MLNTIFPVSGVEAPLWLPLLAGFLLSFFGSMAGISGAVLLLPFQMSVLGFTGPAVSPTNLIFNIVAIPSGVVRYLRERRLVAPLAWIIVAGTTPGVVFGETLRFAWLPDPKRFKIFVASVLLAIAARQVLDLRRRRPKAEEGSGDWSVRTVTFNRRRLAYEFQGRTYQCSTPGILSFSFLVGMFGGIYGIGGGAIMAPFLVAIYDLPIHTVAGATLMGTFITSVVGVLFAAASAPLWRHSGLAASPDWLLGCLFGAGGMCGMYLGARTQRYVSSFALNLLLSAILVAVAVLYLARP